MPTKLKVTRKPGTKKRDKKGEKNKAGLPQELPGRFMAQVCKQKPQMNEL